MADTFIPLSDIDLTDAEVIDGGGLEVFPEEDRSFLDILGANTAQAASVVADRIPLVGGYIDNLVEQVAPETAQGMRDSVSEYYEENPILGRIEDLGTGIVSGQAAAGALSKVPKLQKIASRFPALTAALEGGVEAYGRDIDDGSLSLTTPLASILAGGTAKVASSLLPSEGEFFLKQLDDVDDELLEKTGRSLDYARERGLDLNAVEASTLNSDDVTWTGRAPDNMLTVKADALTQTDPKTLTLANELLEQRRQYADESFLDILDRRIIEGPQDVEEVGIRLGKAADGKLSQIEEQQFAEMTPIFDELRESFPVLKSGKLKNLIDNVPAVRKARSKALSNDSSLVQSQKAIDTLNSKPDFEGPPFEDISVIMATRSNLSNEITQAGAKGDTNAVRQLSTTLEELDGLIDESTEGMYSRANEAASEIYRKYAPRLKGSLKKFSRGVDQFGQQHIGGKEAISRFSNSSPNLLKDTADELGDDKLVRSAYRAGVQSRLKKANRNSANNIFGLLDERGRAEAVLGEQGKELFNDLALNARVRELAQRLQGGAPTARRQAASDTGSIPLSKQGITSYLSRAARNTMDAATLGRNSDMRQKLTELLFTPGRGEELIQLIQSQRNDGGLEALIRALVAGEVGQTLRTSSEGR